MDVNFYLEHNTVYPKHNKITTGNKAIILEPKIMQVLCFMVEHQGEVLSRQQIADNLWPGSIVGLEVITRAIFELRKVLKDDAKQPKYIETIARKGYCFIGKIEPIEEIKSQRLLPDSFLAKVSYKAVIITALLISIIILFLVNAPIRSVKDSPESTVKPSNYQSTILSDGIGEIQSASPSSDWSKILYIQTDANAKESVLILKDVTSHQYSILLRSSDLLRSVIWAKHNNASFFIQCESTECKVNKLFTDNGTIQEIYSTKSKLKSIKLSPNGKQLALTTMNNGRLSISLLSLESQQESPLSINKKTSNYAATFKNSGSGIFYVQQSSSQATINDYNFANKVSKEISTKFSKVTSLQLEDDGNLLIAGQVNSLYSVWRFNIKSKEISQALPISAGSYAYELVSNKAEKQLFYLKTSSNYDISAQGLTKYINLNQVNSHANDFYGTWSVPTKTLYFVSQRTGSYEVWNHKDNKNNKLTNIQADNIRRPILNEKQSQIAFVASQNNQLKLMVYDIKKQQLIVSQNLAKEAHLLSWSSGGDSIYMSIASDNIYDIWQFDMISQQSKIVLLAAGLILKEKADGSFIFGDINSQQLMLKKVDGATTIIKNFKGLALLFRPHSIKLNNNNDVLYYVQQDAPRIKVMSTLLSNAVNESPKELFSLSANDYVTDLGRHESDFVIYDHLESKTSQLVLLQAVN